MTIHPAHLFLSEPFNIACRHDKANCMHKQRANCVRTVINASVIEELLNLLESILLVGVEQITFFYINISIN